LFKGVGEVVGREGKNRGGRYTERGSKRLTKGGLDIGGMLIIEPPRNLYSQGLVVKERTRRGRREKRGTGGHEKFNVVFVSYLGRNPGNGTGARSGSLLFGLRKITDGESEWKQVGLP